MVLHPAKSRGLFSLRRGDSVWFHLSGIIKLGSKEQHGHSHLSLTSNNKMVREMDAAREAKRVLASVKLRQFGGNATQQIRTAGTEASMLTLGRDTHWLKLRFWRHSIFS